VTLLDIVAPTACPECAGPISVHTDPKSEVTTHWCTYDACPGRLTDFLTFIADRRQLEIEGLGPEMAEALVRKGYVTNLADLFEFCNNCAAGLAKLGEEKFSLKVKAMGLSAAAVLKMIDTAEVAKTASWERWIACLGIPMIGITLGKMLARERKLTSEDMAILPTKLFIHPEDKAIDGIGFRKLDELNAFSANPANIDLTLRLFHAGVRPKPVFQVEVADGAPLAGMSFLITGELFAIGSREYITKQFEKLGATKKSGVTKKVTHLIVGTEAGSSKLAKAAELKIPQYGEDWVRETLAKHGINVGGNGLNVDWME